MTRRTERTTDPQRLAAQLHGDISEIAEYALSMRDGSHERMHTTLERLYHQLGNAKAQIAEAQEAIEDARRWGEVPEWDVVAEVPSWVVEVDKRQRFYDQLDNQ